MHDVAFAVDHDIAIVTILDLQNVACDTVCCHGLDELQARLLEGGRVDAAVLVDKVAEQVVDLCSSHLVSRGSIWHDINDTALGRCRGVSFHAGAPNSWRLLLLVPWPLPCTGRDREPGPPT